MTVTARAVEAAKATGKGYKLADGHGLYLFITPAGGKSWRANHRDAGKQKTRTCGRWPEVRPLALLCVLRWEQFTQFLEQRADRFLVDLCLRNRHLTRRRICAQERFGEAPSRCRRFIRPRHLNSDVL